MNKITFPVFIDLLRESSLYHSTSQQYIMKEFFESITILQIDDADSPKEIKETQAECSVLLFGGRGVNDASDTDEFKKKESTFRKYFTGERSIAAPLKMIRRFYDPAYFADFVNSQPANVKERLENNFKAYLPPKSRRDLGSRMAELLDGLVKEILEGGEKPAKKPKPEEGAKTPKPVGAGISNADYINSILDPDQVQLTLAKITSQNEQYQNRDWIDSRFESWLGQSFAGPGQQVLSIIGTPGSGKSAIASHLIEKRGKNCVYFFGDYRTTRANQPVKRVIFALASQLARKNRKYAEALKKTLSLQTVDASLTGSDVSLSIYDVLLSKSEKDLCRLLITEPMQAAKWEDDLLIFIDAVDEIGAEDAPHNPMIGLLELGFPCNIRFVLTTRPHLMEQLAALGSDCLLIDSEKATADIREYFSQRFEDLLKSKLITKEDIHLLTKKSEGNFYYAALMVKNILENKNQPDEIRMILSNPPDGLNDFFRRLFDSVHFTELNRLDFSAALAVIIQLNNAIPVPMLKEIMQWDDEKIAAFENALGDCILHTKDNRITFFHKSLSDWILTNSEAGTFELNTEDAGTRIKAYCKQQFEQYASTGKKYTYSLMSLIYKYYRPKVWDEKYFSFVFQLGLNAYKNSDFAFAKEIAASAKRYAQAHRDTMSDESVVYYCRTRINYYEVCDAFNEQDACKEIIDDLMAHYFEKLRPYPEAFLHLYANHVWELNNQKKSLEALKALDGLDAYMKDLAPEKKDEVFYDYYYAFSLYTRGKICYNMNAPTDAERKSNALKAVKHLKDCIDQCAICGSSANYDPKGLASYALNVLGWACFRLNRFEDELDAFKKSLRIRIDLYGEASQYTARGYDSLARAHSHLYKETHDEALLKRGVSYAKHALKLTTSLYGKTHINACRAMETVALVCELSPDTTAEALEYIKKSETIRKRKVDEDMDGDPNVLKSRELDLATCLEYYGDVLEACAGFTDDKAYLDQALEKYQACYEIRTRHQNQYADKIKERIDRIQKSR